MRTSEYGHPVRRRQIYDRMFANDLGLLQNSQCQEIKD